MKIGASLLPFIRKPFVVLFNITERCNLRCAYCFGRYYKDGDELSLNDIKRILLELRKLGAFRIGFSGGEPLLHPDIDDIIGFADEVGFDIGLNSNGILVPEHIPTLKLLSNLSVSVDGSLAETHDRYRGRGAFEKAMDGITAARESGIPLHFTCTLTDENIRQWRDILALGEKHNALVEFNPMYDQLSKDGKSSPSGSPDNSILETVIREILKEKKTKKRNAIFYPARVYQLLLDWPDSKNDTSSTYVRGHPKCLAGRKMIFLDSRGSMFACQRFSKNMAGNNCLNMGVEQAYRELLRPPCQSCRWACYMNYNLLLNLSWTSVVNFFQIRRKRTATRRWFCKGVNKSS